MQDLFSNLKIQFIDLQMFCENLFYAHMQSPMYFAELQLQIRP